MLNCCKIRTFPPIFTKLNSSFLAYLSVYIPNFILNDENLRELETKPKFFQKFEISKSECFDEFFLNTIANTIEH